MRNFPEFANEERCRLDPAEPSDDAEASFPLAGAQFSSHIVCLNASNKAKVPDNLMSVPLRNEST